MGPFVIEIEDMTESKNAKCQDLLEELEELRETSSFNFSLHQ